MKHIAEEEAAKCLILFDAVRCPRLDPSLFSRQLSYFNHHLAKALYVDSYDLVIEEFGELRDYLNASRVSLYLDGPNGFDWIMRNELEQRRESYIYVDYADYGDHHGWSIPTSFVWDTPSPKSRIIEVCRRLQIAGAFNPNALAQIAKFWRKVSLDDTHDCDSHRKLNLEMFSLLREKGLLSETRLRLVGPLIETLLFRERYANRILSA